jgi:hypothetical protein
MATLTVESVVPVHSLWPNSWLHEDFATTSMPEATSEEFDFVIFYSFN